MAGVFFRALALTMVVSLLTSLVLALTLTPSLAAWFIRDREKLEHGHAPGESRKAAFCFDARHPPLRTRRARGVAAFAGSRCWPAAGCSSSAVFIYRQLETDFLPEFDEGGFVIDYWSPPGTSLTETSRQLDEAEEILRANPDVESYSRRLGAELGLFITEPYRGDFLVKLKPNRKHTTEEVIADLRHEFNERFPTIRWEFPGILTDLVGDLQLTPEPIEIKLFSPDLEWLKQNAPRVEAEIQKVPGVVDTFDGLTETGPSINLRVRPADAARFGLSVAGHRRRREHRAARPDRVVRAGRRPRGQHSRAG